MTMDGIVMDTVDFTDGQILFGVGTIGDMAVIMDMAMAGTILGDGTDGIIGDMEDLDMAMQVLASDGTILTTVMDTGTVMATETTTEITVIPIEVMLTTTQDEVTIIEQH